ncbi:MAG: hypothetical protein NC927_00155 [Candidatus Omnitrophica bacterium]|nr:hypothetical protein [Candidatus Omnitrophota bacterium]
MRTSPKIILFLGNLSYIKKTEAVTLTEVLISSALIFFIFLCAITVQQNADIFFSSITQKGYSQSNADYIMDTILRAVRESKKAYVLDQGAKLQLVDMDDNLIEFTWDKQEKGSIYYYQQNNGAFPISETLGRGVSNLNFSLENRTVVVRLEIEQRLSKKKTVKLDLFSRASLRN